MCAFGVGSVAIPGLARNVLYAVDDMAFSLPLRLGEAGIEGIVAGRSWVSFLGLGMWWFEWSGVRARGEGRRALSPSYPCWGANHLWTNVAPGIGDTGDGGAVLMGIVARSDWR